MTGAAVAGCLLAVVWCLVLLASLAGWGSLGVKITGLRSGGPAMCAAAGVGVAVLLGGLLNLLHLVTEKVLLAGIALGIVLAAVNFLRRRSAHGPADTRNAGRGNSISAGRLVRVLLLLTLAMLGWRLLAAVHTRIYQNSDDYNGYLAFPEKMLEQHYLPPDPFSERRVTSGLGPGYFLQTLVLAELPLENVQMADRALGLLLLAALCWELRKRRDLRPLDVAVITFLAVATPLMMFNLTYVEMPFAIFFAMAMLALDVEPQPGASLLWLGALAAAVGGLKSTYLPSAVLLCFFLPPAVLFRRGIGEMLRLWALSFAGFMGVLAPWMWALHRQEGTYLYPLLGRGFDYSAYHIFRSPSSSIPRVLLLKIILSVVPLVVILAMQLFLHLRARVKTSTWLAAMAVTTACLLGTLAVGAGTGGDSIRRYCYPCIAATMLFFVVVALRERHEDASPRVVLAAWAAGAISLLFAVSVWFNGFTQEAKASVQNVALALRPFRIEPDAVRQEYAALESAIPASGATLATVQFPFLFDFRHRSILLADVPAAAGPPPGWPVFADSEALAAYLRANGVRYLAYSYGDCASMVDSNIVLQQNDVRQTVWVRSQAAMALRAHHQYAGLSRTYRHLFDDGHLYLIDLDEPTAKPQALVSDQPCA